MTHRSLNASDLPPAHTPGTYLVTGASRGIGKSIAAALTERGDQVLRVASRNESFSESDRAQSCELLAADLSSADGRAALVNSLTERKLTGVVHAAGLARHGAFVDLEEQTLRDTLELNFFAPAILTRALLPTLIDGGSVLFVSSTLAQRPARNTAAYAASKAAVESLMASLALELAPALRVNALAPGLVDTQMARQLRLTRGEEMPVGEALQARVESQLDAFAKLHALRRIGTPEEIATAALFLLDHRWITGTVLRIDGGLCVAG